VAVQNVLKQKFNNRCTGGVFFFSGLVSVFAMSLFIAVNREWYFEARLLIPSAGFALSYAAATVFAVLAMKYGSLALSSLIISCSLLIPTFYGMIALSEPVRATLIVGLVMLVGALVMINYRKEKKEGGNALKWAVCVTLAALGNGMCSVVQKAKQEYWGEAGNNTFMIAALAMVGAIMIIIALCYREERVILGEVARKGTLFALACGLANGITNMLVIYLNPRLSASVIFPVISGGSLVMVFIYSVFVEKERFTKMQYAGFFLGVASIILLNL
jgi:drug/metabolite transporter (DMT)-like permease